jgi:hypothetical protein
MRSFVVGTQEWVTDVSSSEDSSDEDNIAGVALIDLESPLPPPSMCLMAKGNSKVYDGESDDEELDPNEFSNLIHEYTCIIKRENGKVKKLERVHMPHLSHLTMTCLQSTMHCSRSMMSHLYSSSKLVINMTNLSLSMWTQCKNTTILSLPMKH